MDSKIATAFQMDIRHTVSNVFLVLVFLVVSLPTGSIFGLNVKMIGFAIFVGVFALFMVTSAEKLPITDLTFLVLVGAFLAFWGLVGAVVGQASTAEILNESRDFVSASAVGWFSIFCIRRGLVRVESLITAVIYGICFLSTLKLVILGAAFFSNIDAVQTTELVFGSESLTPGAISFGLIRMQFSADILGAFALFALLARSVSGVNLSFLKTTLIFWIIFVGAGFFAYSRFVWFLYLVSIFAALIVERKWKTMGVALLVVLIVGTIFYDVFNTVFEARFLSEEADISDIGRVEMFRALAREVRFRPIVGKGMGTHVNTFVSNSAAHNYGYELQWLGFLMQFGVVGETGLFLVVLVSAKDLLASRHPAKPWMFLVFLLWLLASWTNPYLTSSFAGVAFGLFMAMFYRMRNTALPRQSVAISHLPRLQPI